MRRLIGGLYFQVLFAIGLGVVIGHFWPDLGTSLKPLGDGFIKLVKMVIAPIIFCTVVAGIASMEDLKKVGRVGVKALILLRGGDDAGAGHRARRGQRHQAGRRHQCQRRRHLMRARWRATPPSAQKPQGIVDFMLGIIPTNVVGALAQGEILQVLFFAVLFGFALSPWAVPAPRW